MLKIKESPIFYMGNKYKLLKQLIPLFPEQCNTFLDLFGGSAVVSMNYKGKNKTIYNEFNKNIVELVKLFKYSNIEDLDTYFNDKIKEFNIISTGKDFRKNMELQKGYYDFRNYYNGCLNKDYRDLYLLICYSMNHLIRFNKNNEFNASCGSTQRYIKEKIENGNKML
jgi:site-specific DNA-adenine methylase